MTVCVGGVIRRIAIISALLVVAISSTAYAQDEAFRKGMGARKDRKWPDAAAALRQAIQNDPKESSRKIGGLVGLGGDEYLPFFHLGEALLGLGDCAGAIAAWEESDRQGVARKIGNNGRVILDGYKQCEVKGFLLEARLAKEVQEASAAYRAASDAYQGMLQDIKEHPNIKLDADARSNAEAQLATAKERLSSAQRTRRAQDFVELRSLLESTDRTIRNGRQVIAAAAAGAEAFSQRARDAEVALQQAETQMRDLDTILAATSPLKVTPSEGVTADRARAGTLLAGAREKLRNATRTQTDTDLTDATRSGQEAALLIGRVRAQFESEVTAATGTAFASLQANAAGLATQLDEVIRTIEQRLRERPEGGESSAEFAKLQTALTRARRSMERSIKARDLPAAQTAAIALEQLGPQFDSLAARLGIATTLALPAALSNGAQALFENRYADVLDALSPDEAASVPMQLRVHVHVIRSAALFALHEYSGSSDDTLLRRAREEANLGRAVDPAFRPSSAAFSPRFINFYLAAPQAAR
jgi:hypothetical protein